MLPRFLRAALLQSSLRLCSHLFQVISVRVSPWPVSVWFASIFIRWRRPQNGQQRGKNAGCYCGLSCLVSVMSFCLIRDSRGRPAENAGGCWLWGVEGALRAAQVGQRCCETPRSHHALTGALCVSSRTVACSSTTRRGTAVTLWRATCSATAATSGAWTWNCRHIRLRATPCMSQNSERRCPCQ